MPSIADVSVAAGVSKAPVSRVLNNTSPYLRAETRQRVERAIAELAFDPAASRAAWPPDALVLWAC